MKSGLRRVEWSVCGKCGINWLRKLRLINNGSNAIKILIADIQDLKNGNQAIEDHARADLGMIKPGEVLYQLP